MCAGASICVCSTVPAWGWCRPCLQVARPGRHYSTPRAQQRGAEGVGLYRTEVPFMINQRFPSEKEQLAIYREQLQAFHPLPVTMRRLRNTRN